MKKKTSKFNIFLIFILLINISVLYFFYQNEENRLLVENYFEDFLNKEQESLVELENEIEIVDITDWKIYENTSIKDYLEDLFGEKQENVLITEKEAEIENPVIENVGTETEIEEQVTENIDVEVENEEQTIDTTNWKTYEDSSYDFKIKYPDYWPKPQTEELNDENLDYQYKVKFGITDTLNGTGDEGFFVLVSKKNVVTEDIDKCNYIYNQGQNNLNQENNQNSFSLYPLPELKETEDFTTCYSYQLNEDNFEYKLTPILSDNSDFSSIKINNLYKFKLANDSFVIDSENIQKKAIELEKAERIATAQRIAAVERARQARIEAAEKARQARLRSCPKEGNGDPSYSKTKGKHMDEDCCPDPDEWANPRCRYNASGLKILIKKK